MGEGGKKGNGCLYKGSVKSFIFKLNINSLLLVHLFTSRDESCTELGEGGAMS